MASESTVKSAFQLEAFLQTGHKAARSIPADIIDIIHHLTTTNLRPTSLRSKNPTSSQGTTRARSSSVDTPTWPQDWAVDKVLLRSDLKKFGQATTPIRSLLFDPPSTGNTPPRTTPERRSRSDTSPGAPSVSSLTDTPRPTTPLPDPPSMFGAASGNRANDGNSGSMRQPDSGHNPRQPDAGSNQGFTDTQRNELTDMIARAIRSIAPPPPPPGGPPDNNEGPDPNAHRMVHEPVLRFNPDDVGYFDPFYDNKSSDTAADVEHSGKATYFRDVYTFIDRIRDVARAKGETLVRQNLQLCLRGSAMVWYTRELTEDSKRLLGYNVEEWYRLLQSRWKAPRHVGLSALLRERYTIQDASRKREPREYAQVIVKAAQNAEIGTLKDHVMIVWQNLDMEFQRDIPEPGHDVDLDAFLKSLDSRKYQWWHHASRYGRTQPQPASRRSDARYDGGNRGGYKDSQSLRPFQPLQGQFQNYRQQPYRSDNAYYGNQQYRNEPQNVRQSSRPETKLQITAPAGTSVSGSQRPEQINRPYQPQQPQQQPGPRYPNQRLPFRPAGNFQRYPQQPQYPQKPQKAYQAATEEEENGYNEPHDDHPSHDNYEESEEAYHGTESPHQDYDPAESFQAGFPNQEPEYYADGYFTAVPTPDHQCQRCRTRFASKNKLFAHLREECWKSQLREPSAGPVKLEKAIEVQPPLQANAAHPNVITSSSEPISGTGYAFRNYHYAVASLSWSAGGQKHEFCADPGCTMSVMDRTFMPSQTEVKRIPTKIPIRGIGSDLHYSDEYAVVTFYLEGTLSGSSDVTFARITREVHLVDDLKAGMLMGADILTPEHMAMDFSKQTLVVGSCKSLIVPISTRARSAPVKRVIKAKARLTVPARSTTSIQVAYSGVLPSDRDMLFEPACQLPLGVAGGIYAHIVDAQFSQVQVTNDTDFEVVVPRKARLGTVEELESDGCFMVEAHHAGLAVGSPKSWTRSLVKGFTMALAAGVGLQQPPAAPDSSSVQSSINTPVSIDPRLEHVMPNGVTVYGRSPEAAMQLSATIEDYKDLFVDKGETVDIPEDQWMPIPLKPGATSKPARVYPVGQKDRDVIDATHDKLHAQGKMEWSTQPTPFSYPVFVVWKTLPSGERKGRVVVDIRELNRITEHDTYPLPLQSDIIGICIGHAYISIVDAVGWFHQFRVQVQDRHKLTVVSHRGQEQSSVALMGYKGSPPYVQRQTDALLRLYPFAKAYVDDIIIFSHTLEDHLRHLRQIFDLFRQRRVSLSPTKSFIGYPSVTLLGQRVDGLGLSTSQEKIAAIAALDFPSTLRDLEIFLGLTGWLRQSIPRYAQRADALQKRKVMLTKGLGSGAKGPARKRSAVKVLFYDPTDLEKRCFDDLKQAFAAPTFLAHFDQHRPLYVDLDASKAWGFAAMVYHVKEDSNKDLARPFPRTDVQPIMFLSKMLNSAEGNYWPTELEVAGIVWVVRKIRHLVEASKGLTVIYTDHSAAVPISRQTSLSSSSTDKLNLRLVRASQYLSQFDLVVKHKSGKSNVVPDALSRLRAAVRKDHESPDGVLDALFTEPALAEAFNIPPAEASRRPMADLPEIYHATLVNMTDDFKARLREAYGQDEHWEDLRDMLQPPADDQGEASPDRPEGPPDEPVGTTKPGLSFTFRDDLIYHVNGEGRLRLCVPNSMEQELFEQVHDQSNHAGFHRSFESLSHSVYLRHLSKHLRTYIAHCPQCQVNQTKRHRPYGELVPISTPAIPFHTVAMDFIVGFPLTSAGHNCLLTITCKFTKRVLLVPGYDEWKADKWAEIVLIAWLSHDWGIPQGLISDRDARFMSDFWERVFALLKVKFLTATAYHPQTDGQSERTNQTVEIAMRFHLTEHPDSEWDQILPYMQASLNNSPNTSTGSSPNELCYGFKVNNSVGLLSDLPPEDFDRLRLQKRESAEDCMAFASVMMKARYDLVHKAITIKAGDRVYLRLHQGYKIPGVANRKLSQQRVGPFIVQKKVGQLAYQLELPPIMKIHPVVSIAQLEPKVPGHDPYGRNTPEPPPVITEDGEHEYTIERLLDRRTRYGKLHYLVKWLNYGNEYNVWYDIEDLQNAQDLIQDYDLRHPPGPTNGERPRRTARTHRPRNPSPEPDRPRRPLRPTRGMTPARGRRRAAAGR